MANPLDFLRARSLKSDITGDIGSHISDTAGGSVPPAAVRSAKITLATLVGAAVAVALGVAIPKEESGRTVTAGLDKDTGALVTKHVAGRQYLKAYLDIVGVATACDGLTSYKGRPVRIGQTFTEAQCSTALEEALIEHAQGVMRCTPGLAISPNTATEGRRAGPRFAAVSLAYNIGVSRYCASTAAKRYNAGNYAGGCEAQTWFKYAGGRVVKGLVNRRAREYNVCVGGLGAL